MIWLTLILIALFVFNLIYIQYITYPALKYQSEWMAIVTLAVILATAFGQTHLIVWLVTDSGILK